jgi:hypothetical protein
VVRDLLIETQPVEPAPGQVHAQLDQLALAGDAYPICRMRGKSSGSIDGLPVSLHECFNFSRTNSKLTWRSMRRSKLL